MREPLVEVRPFWVFLVNFKTVLGTAELCCVQLVQLVQISVQLVNFFKLTFSRFRLKLHWSSFERKDESIPVKPWETKKHCCQFNSIACNRARHPWWKALFHVPDYMQELGNHVNKKFTASKCLSNCWEHFYFLEVNFASAIMFPEVNRKPNVSSTMYSGQKACN